MTKVLYLSQTLSVDAGHHDGSVAPDGEPEALGVRLLQLDRPGHRPVVLGREDRDRAQPREQVLHLELAEVGESQGQLELGGRSDGRGVQNLLQIKINYSIFMKNS